MIASKKNRHLPVDLAGYFINPCPVLSANNARAIRAEMPSFPWVVEYGLGASTVYFLEGFAGRYIAVENNIHWFDQCLPVLRHAGFEETGHVRRRWTADEMRHFLSGPAAVPGDGVPARYPVWREKLLTGPFFRFSPLCKHSRLRGRLGPLWRFAKPVFAAVNRIVGARETEAQWDARRGDALLTLRNVPPSIKDQNGEAPNYQDYIDAGLKDIRAALEAGQEVKALFLIDGGPRMKILESVLALRRYPGFRPTIMLCDAWRTPYADILAAHNGTFWPGTNLTLKGDAVVGTPEGARPPQELAAKELWVLSA
jgi:hypothetical protein